MTMRMLIDARHQEETRVAVVKGNRIEEFDFESAERKQLKGNIYLAKVTRVEPSLQAAFVDFGGNRHGFLAFSEIHPDYYQIPKEDREALLREEAEHAAEEEALRAAEEGDEDEGDADFVSEDGRGYDEAESGDEDHDHDQDHDHDHQEDAPPPPRPQANHGEGDAVEALRKRRMALRRRYKIQDVIRRRQVLLVQVVKEERGNKGAALTTYLSLAGRYCVLMPNTSHGGGISRKISNAADRKRLKSIMAEMKLPSTMGCIVRTAGLQRTKTEIKRDFDYLARLWDEIRDKTLASAAPAMIYADNDLIKRAIRDIYNKDIDEVIVEGEDGFRAARSFMRLLMPAHAKKVQPYADAVPLFQRAGVEDQLNAMYNPVVQLKSGGYLVINPTEALVSIDINSGRSTREHNIEQTATATNLEAAAEIARQLRLRDMAGLVVIDFIDMENNSNVRKVEKAMKEALKNDRARIQIGRISSFGLMEMSRQRLRTGVLEASTRTCPHCEGTGLVRTASSAGLSALRMLEDEAARGRGSRLCLRASQEAAIYVLNRKRAELAEIEDRYGVHIEIIPDGNQEGARMTVEVAGPPPEHAPRIPALPVIEPDEDEDLVDEVEEEEEEAETDTVEDAPRRERAERPERGEGEEGDRNGRRRRRRRRRGGRRDDQPQGEEAVTDASESAGEDEEEDGTAAGEALEPGTARADTGEEAGAEEDEAPLAEGGRRRGRRGRRGGRNRAAGVETAQDAEPAPLNADADAGSDADAVAPQGEDAAGTAAPVEAAAPAEAIADETAPKPRARRRPRARAAEPAEAGVAPEVAASADAAPEPAAAPADPADEPAPKPRRTRRKAAAETTVEAAPAAATAAADDGAGEAARPKRTRRRKAEPDAPLAEAAPEPAAATPEPAAVAPEVAASQTAPEPAAAAPDGDAETVAESEPAPRRGWWQRTFGG